MASRIASTSCKSLHVRSACTPRGIVARAEDKKDNTVFYGGNSYTESEWNKARDSGEYKSAPVGNETTEAASAPTIGALMAFDGPAPELVNGRLAMLGFLAALGAEISSGEGVLMQLGDAPAPVLLTFTIIAAASFIPLLQGIAPESRALGPLNANAERSNGRAAMIGLVALVVTELFLGGKALF